MKRLGILLSGRGSNFEAIAEHIDRGDLAAEIAVVISNVSRAPGLEKARQRGLQAVYVNPTGLRREDFDRQVVSVLRQKEVDLVCLAGFLQLLRIPPDFAGRVLNIHPALLPAFGGKGMYGHHVHEAVLRLRGGEGKPGADPKGWSSRRAPLSLAQREGQ